MGPLWRYGTLLGLARSGDFKFLELKPPPPPRLQQLRASYYETKSSRVL